jgi:hypothetical protein
MPSKSVPQHRLMEVAAHDPEAAKKAGIPQKVAREFVMADVGRKLAPAKTQTMASRKK